MSTCVTINDTVSVTNPTNNRTATGIVRFIGAIEQQIGIFYGIEFESSENNSLYFVKRKDILSSQPSDMPRVTVGDIVKVTKFNCNGVIRYIGNTQFKEDIIWYGVQLEEAKGKNNGRVSDIKYFECEPNYGIFVQANGIQKIANRKKKKRTKSTKQKIQKIQKPQKPSRPELPRSQPGTPPGEQALLLGTQVSAAEVEGLIVCEYVKKEEIRYWSNRVPPVDLTPYESMRQDGTDNDTIANILRKHCIAAYWINKFFLSQASKS